MDQAKLNASESVRAVVNTYIAGYLQAEREWVLNAFHEETRLFSVDQGKLEKTLMTEWLSNMEERKKRGDVRSANSRIENIDVSNNAASVKVILTFQKYQFTDYLSLLRIGDEWKVVGKIYNVENI